MKTTNYLLAALVALVGVQAQAQSRLVELPPAAYANTRTLEISKVSLSDTTTVLDVEAFFTPGYWIRIVSDSYLLADGKKYMIREGQGIDLDSLFWMPKSGEASFKLVFDPLPNNTEKFDFIESDCEDCFKIYGIDLVNSRMELPEIPRQFIRDYQPEKGFKTAWKKGEATVSGVLWKFVPGTLDWSLMYRNPITGEEDNVPVEVAEDGTFSASITVYSPTNLYLSSRMARHPIKVAPDEESSLFVNLPEIYRAGSQLLKDQPPYGEKIYYGGYLAKLNSDLANDGILHAMLESYIDSLADMNIIEFKDFMLEKYHEGVEHNNALDISPLAKSIVHMMEVTVLQNRLVNADWAIIDANMKKYNLSREEAQKAYTPIQKPENYTDFYQLIPHNDMDILLVPDITYTIRGLSYARADSSDPYMILRYLSQHQEVAEEDQEFLITYITTQEKNEAIKFERDESLESVVGKYQELTDEYIKTQMGEGFLSRVWNTDEALLLELIKAQKISAAIQDFNPLTEEQKQELSTFPEVIRQVVMDENEALLARIEENKKKTGFTVLNTPENIDEELFVEMMKPFKGKVILVDVWATWCGPCRMANKAMEPLKAQFADEEDLVFLYLAGENSPENTWKNMITDMKGEHYRVNEAQWNYLSESLNARGVPTYIIIDREGNHTFHSVGFPGADTMKRELLKALGE